MTTDSLVSMCEQCGHETDYSRDHIGRFCSECNYEPDAVTENTGNGDWFYDGSTWFHCDRPAVIGDDNVECSKCQQDWPDDETVAE